MPKKPRGPLRQGWTTGACAAAAAKAAYTALLTGEFPDPVEILLPKGDRPSFALARKELAPGLATAGIVKDAGDDPDVTHGALILSTVRLIAAGRGVVFRAGDGVGMVTKPGLPIPPGEPAINPTPRQIMAAIIAETAAAHGGNGDVEITISVPGGGELARKTWNPRLGIVGGISILGTTGVVHPYSCSAWIASIHRGIDVCRANGVVHAAACTGSTSEAAVRRLYQLPDIALIDMGDFAGGTLKYLRRHPIQRLTIAGGFGKLCKLADGAMDLHSARSEIDRERLAERLQRLGAASDVIAAARTANTAGEILALSQAQRLPLGEVLAGDAKAVALAMLDGRTAVEVIIMDRNGAIVGRAGF
ncbi:MAG TPA: cobalt-precorrin-5B (C(1))-methyltransferase [Candidatus Udaeobacter sp.]|nr:cobalt-precorrin-5B (C(1))-methyltransferase [Candidatus Udaeobacter sp.]